MGYIRVGWFWFGNQGMSYIQLGRFWQIGFFVGLALWSALVLRALWPTSAGLIVCNPAILDGRHYAGALVMGINRQYRCAVCIWNGSTDGHREVLYDLRFWRWWVVHLWVEQSFEFFAAAHYCLFVDGRGPCVPQVGPNDRYISKSS